MRFALMLPVLILSLMAQGASAGVRSAAVSRSTMPAEVRQRLMRAAQYADSRSRSIQARSVYDATTMAAIGRRSELPTEAVSKLQADYSDAQKRLLDSRSEYRPEVLRRMGAASDAPSETGRVADSDPAWRSRVTRSSTGGAHGVSTSEAVRVLLGFVLRNSVASDPSAPADRDIRSTIQRQSSD